MKAFFLALGFIAVLLILRGLTLWNDQRRSKKYSDTETDEVLHDQIPNKNQHD